jgi:hypothetical protein
MSRLNQNAIDFNLNPFLILTICFLSHILLIGKPPKLYKNCMKKSPFTCNITIKLQGSHKVSMRNDQDN